MSTPNKNKSNPCYERFAPVLVPIRQPQRNADGEVTFEQHWFAADPLEVLQQLVVTTETVERNRANPMEHHKPMRFGTTKLATDTLALPTKQRRAASRQPQMGVIRLCAVIAALLNKIHACPLHSGVRRVHHAVVIITIQR